MIEERGLTTNIGANSRRTTERLRVQSVLGNVGISPQIAAVFWRRETSVEPPCNLRGTSVEPPWNLRATSVEPVFPPKLVPATQNNLAHHEMPKKNEPPTKNDSKKKTVNVPQNAAAHQNHILYHTKVASGQEMCSFVVGSPMCPLLPSQYCHNYA